MTGLPPEVLVVDDDAMIRRGYGRTLASVCRATLVEDGEAALELLEQGAQFDLVICDLSMPRMDGRALFAEMRLRFPACARNLVFCTGTADPLMLDQLAALTGHRPLTKPVAGASLRALVNGFVTHSAHVAAPVPGQCARPA